MRILNIPDGVRAIFTREKITFALSTINGHGFVSNGETDGYTPVTSVGFFGANADSMLSTNSRTTIYPSSSLKVSSLRELFLAAAERVAQQFDNSADNAASELKRARATYRKEALAGEVGRARESAEKVRALTAEIAAAWPEEVAAQKGGAA